MKISMIAGMSSNHAIGIKNKTPWHIAADLKHFKKITMGKPIIMGRKTYESIGRPLPGRQNIILSRKGYEAEGCWTAQSIDQAMKLAEGNEIIIIGGESIYRLFMEQAKFLYLTLIHAHFEGDTHFPKVEPKEWRVVARQDINEDKSVPFSYSFVELERK